MGDLLTWEEGRQGTGYEKMLLATGECPVPFDCYLLKYPEGSAIPYHKDPVENGKHYRLNIVVKPAKKGGHFVVEGEKSSGLVNLFRPDLKKHKVTEIEEGTRYVLSIGFVYA